MMAVLLATTALAAAPVEAKATHHRVSCTKVRDELAGGKSTETVAKEMKLKEATVKQCQASAPKHQTQASRKK
jgi:hypothetical protein